MAFTLPPLPYAYDALLPHIDAKTMEIHHTKHHQAYINNANKALEAHPALAAKSVEALISDMASVPDDIRTVIRNNAGGHANHSLFWTVMGPGAGGEPTGALADAINAAFGSLATFK
ncbi:MAG: superoxide dismutase, partial [Planctomycetota bacterium]